MFRESCRKVTIYYREKKKNRPVQNQCICGGDTNSLTKDIDQSKLKGLADDNLNVFQIIIIPSYKEMWEKGENAGYQHLLLLQQCFIKPSSLWS